MKATVDRPFSIAKAHYDQTLDQDLVDFNIPIEVDPKIPVDSLIGSELQGLLQVSVVRKAPDGEECSILLRGNRDTLLRSKTATISIAYNNGSDRTVSESVQISFHDGNLLRIIPRVVEVTDGQISFMIFKQGKVDIDRITVTTEAGEKLATEFVLRSPGIVAAKVRVPTEFSEKQLLVSDGNSDVRIDLDAKQEKGSNSCN